MSRIASVRTTNNSEVLVTDRTYAASAIRDAGINPRPLCRIGRVAWVQENFWGCNSARRMPCMSAKPPLVIESRVDTDVCKSSDRVQRRRCDTKQVDAQ